MIISESFLIHAAVAVAAAINSLGILKNKIARYSGIYEIEFTENLRAKHRAKRERLKSFEIRASVDFFPPLNLLIQSWSSYTVER